MRRRRHPLLALLLFGLGWACAESEAPAPEPRLSAVAALSARRVEGFTRAMAPRTFEFPADHGPHPDFAIEWWYFTGNLEGPEGRRFGYQLTFFRSALAPHAAERSSAWASRQIYFAHFAVTDAGEERFHAFERWSRGGAGLAGARSEPFTVWLEDWSVRQGEDGSWRLRAAEDGLELELTLRSLREPVLHGDRGLSRKGSEPGDASYYFSLTHLESSGGLRVGDSIWPVSGLSWMDREWSTSLLGESQVGWDWLSLQLDDGSALMLFELRLADGGVDPVSHGTWIPPQGDPQPLTLQDFDLISTDTWRSPRGGRYPAAWSLRIPGQAVELEIRPLIANQELDLSFRYWEGAVEAGGTAGGRPVTGRGYFELVGYGEASSGSKS